MALATLKVGPGRATPHLISAEKERRKNMTVIPFRDRRLARPPGRPVEPPPALKNQQASAAAAEEDAEFYRVRARQNWAVLALIVALVVGGAWLIERLAAFSRAVACYEFGHRNCMPLKIDLPPR